ncbi:MAG: transposase [Acidobacteria bacterium]|nr:MAG: transposase [Acidobacteriota bacterium]
MPRRPRVVLPGFPHHVTHRGNRKEPIFLDDYDRLFYLSKLAKYTCQYEVPLYGYGLMTTHVHHVAVPPTEESLSCCLHDLHGTYADHFNNKYGLTGHLFEERFYACALDEAHLWNAVRYVEQNPVRAGLVRVPEDYRWSSAQGHCGLREDRLLSQDFPPRGVVPNWREWLSANLTEKELEQIRNATRKGIPCASEAFLRQLEVSLGIPLLPRRRGRPPSLPRGLALTA